MNFKLNFWQTLTLFLPFIVGILIFDLCDANFYQYQTYAATANILFVVNILLAVLYQTYLTLAFNSKLLVGSNIYKWNAYIPLAFITFYLAYVIYLTSVHQKLHVARRAPGPMLIAHPSISTYLIYLFLIHAFVTFYFIKGRFVAKKIRVMPESLEKEQLKMDFLIPIQRLTRISIWVFVAAIIFSTIADIVNFRNML